MSLTRSLLLILALAGVGCDFQKQADAKFGDQHFKTAISLVELHKVRTGSYPASMKDLKFTGEWDAIAINSVEYKRLSEGYELNVTRGWVGQPTLSYPPEFWHGLGLRKSNLRARIMKRSNISFNTDAWRRPRASRVPGASRRSTPR